MRDTLICVNSLSPVFGIMEIKGIEDRDKFAIQVCPFNIALP